MPKIQHNNDQFHITLPKTLVAQKDWKKGQEIFLLFNERGNIELTDKL
jgi:hypothetical protein